MNNNSSGREHWTVDSVHAPFYSNRNLYTVAPLLCRCVVSVHHAQLRRKSKLFACVPHVAWRDARLRKVVPANKHSNTRTHSHSKTQTDDMNSGDSVKLVAARFRFVCSLFALGRINRKWSVCNLILDYFICPHTGFAVSVFVFRCNTIPICNVPNSCRKP